jgi:hypothetical protein
VAEARERGRRRGCRNHVGLQVRPTPTEPELVGDLGANHVKPRRPASKPRRETGRLIKKACSSAATDRYPWMSVVSLVQSSCVSSTMCADWTLAHPSVLLPDGKGTLSAADSASRRRAS